MKTVTTLVNNDTMTAYLQKQMSHLKSMDAREVFEIINELHFSKQKLVRKHARNASHHCDNLS